MTKVRRAPEAWLSTSVALPILAYLEERGVDPAGVLGSAGLAGVDFGDPEGRITQGDLVELLQAGAGATSDPTFALHAAERMDLSRMDLAKYLAASMPTIGEAYQRIEPYIAAVHTGLRTELVSMGSTVHCRFELQPGVATSRAVSEYLLARCIVAGRLVLGGGYRSPTEVHFRSAAPTATTEHRRVFGCPVLFGQPHDAFVFPPEHLELPVLSANPGLARLLETQARRELERIPRGSTLTDRVSAWLEARLPSGDLGLEALAVALRMSPRTVRRRLREEGTSHSELLDSVRLRRAVTLLRDGSPSDDELAYHLGFSQASAMRRAFKRWTGMTPSQYARTLDGRP